MTLLDKLKRLIVCRSHERSAPESQMPISNLVRTGDAPKSSESRVRSTKIRLGVDDMITMPKTKQSPQITLQSIPTELLTEIVTLLEPVDRASLAFTSSWLHGLFGNTTKLNGFDSWMLVQRLERINMWPSEILCEICRKFHEPRKSRETFTEKEGRRSCIRNGAQYMQQLSISPNLPTEVHFDVIAAISRSHHFNPDSLFLGEPSVQYVSPFVNDDDELIVRLQQTQHFSSQRHLLLKSPRILFPGRTAGRESNKLIEGLETLHQTFEEISELGTICGHAKWIDLYPFITRPEKGLKWHQGQWSFRHSGLQEFDLPGEQLRESLWTHKGDCWLTCQARARLDSALDGRIWSCGGCSTDYAVNIIRSESSCANYIVMTSWKDLGTCIRRDDPLWQEHLDSDIDAGHRCEEFGTIAEQIEKLTRGARTRVYYFPQISKKRLREIFIDEGGDKEPKVNRKVEVDSWLYQINSVLPESVMGHYVHCSFRLQTDVLCPFDVHKK